MPEGVATVSAARRALADDLADAAGAVIRRFFRQKMPFDDKADTLFATSPDMFQGADATGFARLKAAAKLTRHGGDCYAYGLVASGFIDCVVEAGLKPYDYCALVPVIEGAGGIMTDWQGRTLG